MKTRVLLAFVIGFGCATDAHSRFRPVKPTSSGKVYTPAYKPIPVYSSSFKENYSHWLSNHSYRKRIARLYNLHQGRKSILSKRSENLSWNSFLEKEYARLHPETTQQIQVGNQSCTKSLLELLGKKRKQENAARVAKEKSAKAIQQVASVVDLCPKSNMQYFDLYGHKPSPAQSAIIKKFQQNGVKVEHTPESIVKTIESTPDGELTIIVGHSSISEVGKNRLILSKKKELFLELDTIYNLAKERKKNVFVVTCHSPQVAPNSRISIEEAQKIVNRLKVFVSHKGANHEDLIKVAQTTLKSSRRNKVIKNISIVTVATGGTVVIWSSDDESEPNK